MKLFKILSLLLIAGLLMMGLVACDEAGETGTATDPEAAEAAVEDAQTALEEGDMDSALDSYTTAALADPTNGEALLGYAMLEIMSITVDPDMVSLAKTRLGLVNYPDNMNDLIEGTMGSMVSPDDPDYTGDYFDEYWAPDISGMEDTDGDGIISEEERGLAAIEFFVTHNTDGFNAVVDGMSSVIEDRIDAALTAIDKVPADSQIVLPGDFTGINDASGINPQDIVVGQAEAQIIAAFLLAFRSQIRMGQVYDYTLPLEDYWNFAWDYMDYMNGELGATEPVFQDLQTPFAAGFLSASDDATTKLGEAKADMREMISRMTGAIATIEGRSGSTFSVSPGSTFEVDMEVAPDDPLTIAEVWNDEVAPVLNFADALFTRIDESLAGSGGTTAYIPIYNDEYEDDGDPDTDEFDWMTDMVAVGAWPDSTNLDFEGTSPCAVGIDFGAFYSSPLLAINAIFDLDDTPGNEGEPVFYEWDGAGGFDVASTYTADTFYYIKVKDITFNGTISSGIFPTDTKDGPYTIETIEEDGGDFDWVDGDGNPYWDLGEDIEDHGVRADVNGIISIGDYSVEGPAEYYWSDIDFSDDVALPDTELQKIIDYGAYDGSVADLRSDLVTYYASEPAEPDMGYGPVAVLDTDDAVYFALPRMVNFAVEDSLTAAGNTGSFWWAFVDMFAPMLMAEEE